SLKNFAAQVTAGVKWIAGQIMNFPAWLLGIVMKTLTDFTVKVIAGVKWVAGEIMNFFTWLYNIIFGGESPHIDLSTIVNILEWVAGSIVSFSEWLLGIILAIPLDIAGVIVNIASWIAGSIVDLVEWLTSIITDPSIIKNAIVSIGQWLQGAWQNLSAWLTGVISPSNNCSKPYGPVGIQPVLGCFNVSNLSSTLLNALTALPVSIFNGVQTMDAGINMLGAATPLAASNTSSDMTSQLSQLLAGNIKREMLVTLNIETGNAVSALS
ncbi:MAG: hypothetical protein EZS28_052617, partial [Streblomastix strix]